MVKSGRNVRRDLLSRYKIQTSASEWIDTFDIEGTHESKTSESYAFEYDLKSNKAIKAAQ
jgi:hypothetical protein